MKDYSTLHSRAEAEVEYTEREMKFEKRIPSKDTEWANMTHTHTNNAHLGIQTQTR